MQDNATVSLEILLLNDLLRTNVIDMELYEKAAKIITAIIPPRKNEQSTVLASA